MSMETWIAEFYPTNANSEEAKAAPVAHSLRKWVGLREENLEKHGVVAEVAFGELEDAKGILFGISGDTCALCVVYAEDCRQCPVTSLSPACDIHGSAYRNWREKETPEPMIELLTKLLERGEK